MFGAGRQGFSGGGGSGGGDYYNEYQIWFAVPSGTTGTVKVAKEGGGEIDPSKYTVLTGQYPYGYDAIAWKMEGGEITTELAIDTEGFALQIDLSGDDNTTWTVADGATPAEYPFAIAFIVVANASDFNDVNWKYVIGNPAPVILFPNVVQRSGVNIKYDTDTQYNTNLSTGTGDITADLTGARLGATCILFHSGATEPTYPATWTKLAGSQDYNTASDWNMIVSQYHSATFQTYYIVPEDYVVLSNIQIFNGTVGVAETTGVKGYIDIVGDGDWTSGTWRLTGEKTGGGNISVKIDLKNAAGDSYIGAGHAYPEISGDVVATGNMSDWDIKTFANNGRIYVEVLSVADGVEQWRLTIDYTKT
jgi:hypothetical protein